MNTNEAWQAATQLGKEEFEARMALIPDRIASPERRDLLFKFIKSEIQVGYDCSPDLQAYALKCMMPTTYSSFAIRRHPYSEGPNWEYDPPKNGQNLIKHGLGFGEVASYSGGTFGVYSVPCPDPNDEERWVVFSGLDLSHRDARLTLPIGVVAGRANCTVSITQFRNGRYRFISAHLLSSDKDVAVTKIRQKLKKFSSDPRDKEAVVDRAVEFIDTYVRQ